MGVLLNAFLAMVLGKRFLLPEPQFLPVYMGPVTVPPSGGSCMDSGALLLPDSVISDKLLDFSVPHLLLLWNGVIIAPYQVDWGLTQLIYVLG